MSWEMESWMPFSMRTGFDDSPICCVFWKAFRVSGAVGTLKLVEILFQCFPMYFFVPFQSSTSKCSSDKRHCLIVITSYRKRIYEFLVALMIMTYYKSLWALLMSAENNSKDYSFTLLSKLSNYTVTLLVLRKVTQ